MTLRRRQRGGGGLGAARTRHLVLVGVAAFFLVGTLLPTGAFTLVDAARVGSFGVVADANAELGLNVYACVDKDNVDPLVDVENNLREGVDVTVALVDPSLGTLHVGSQSGDSVTFALAVGGSDTVSLETTAGGPWPKTVEFTIDAVGTDTSVSASRSSQVDNNCGSATPTPTPTATPVPGNEPPVADFTVTRFNPNKVDVDASPSSDPDGTIVSYEWDVGADGTIDATGQTARLDARSGTDIKLIVTDDAGATNSTTKTAP